MQRVRLRGGGTRIAPEHGGNRYSVAAAPASWAAVCFGSMNFCHAAITVKANRTGWRTPIVANVKAATSLLILRCAKEESTR